MQPTFHRPRRSTSVPRIGSPWDNLLWLLCAVFLATLMTALTVLRYGVTFTSGESIDLISWVLTDNNWLALPFIATFYGCALYLFTFGLTVRNKKPEGSPDYFGYGFFLVGVLAFTCVALGWLYFQVTPLLAKGIHLTGAFYIYSAVMALGLLLTAAIILVVRRLKNY